MGKLLGRELGKQTLQNEKTITGKGRKKFDPFANNKKLGENANLQTLRNVPVPIPFSPPISIFTEEIDS